MRRPLKGTTMTTSAPQGPDDRRILPWRPRTETLPVPQTERDEPAARAREDAARHYLKFMLPSIPIATFILSFVLCAVLLGVPAGAIGATGTGGRVTTDPTLPFLSALVLSLITGILCMWIYFGYLRVSGAEDHHRPS